jgi:branched-chain amino acid transport system substrate-binding protein
MRRALIATVAVAGLALTACGGGTATATPSPGSPITIGVSVSLSGDFSSDGPALEKGYDLWAEDVNKKGGLLGHPVKMEYKDDLSSTTQVVTNYQNMNTSDKAELVFGPYSRSLPTPAADVLGP